MGWIDPWVGLGWVGLGRVSQLMDWVTQNEPMDNSAINAPTCCRTLTRVKPVLFAFNLQTKVEMCSFIRYKDMAWAPKCRNESRDTGG